MSVIEIKKRRCTRLTRWMGFHAGNVSDCRSQAEEADSDSRTEWGFMPVMSVIEIQEAHSDPQSGWDFMQAPSALTIDSIIWSLPPVGNIQTSPLY